MGDGTKGWRDKLLTAYSKDENGFVAYWVEKCAVCGCDVYVPGEEVHFGETSEQEFKFARSGLMFRREMPSKAKDIGGDKLCDGCYNKIR